MTATAHSKLQEQQGIADLADIELAAQGVEVDNFLLDAASRHGLKVNVAESITAGYIERTMEGANVLSVTIHDGTGELLRSGMFGTNDNTKLPAIDVLLDGLWFRLTEFDKNGQEITLVFEDRIIAFLRTHTRPISASRGSVTRAQFIQRMVSEVKKQHIRFYSPELRTKQPIEGVKPKKKSERQRKAELAGGLLSTTDLKIKGEQADKNQLEVCEQVLDAGVQMNANHKVLVSSIMCIIDESVAGKDHLTDPNTGIGPFSQLRNGAWPATGNATTDAGGYFQRAIANDKANPNMSLTALVHSVQANKDPNVYAQFQGEAEKIVTEYGSGTGKAAEGRVYYKAFEFHRGPPDGPVGEDTWAASFRLAQEVNWRRFVLGNTFYYVQDKDLMKRKPIAEFDEDTEGIEQIDGKIAANMKVNEVTVSARATRWWAPPGSVVKIKKMGPFTGRWLVFKIHRELFSPNCTVTLHQPEAAKPEKAPEERHVEVSGNTTSPVVSGGLVQGGEPRDRIVAAAKWGLEHKDKFRYAQVRPMAKSLFEPKAWTTTDCSSFATLCYKAAGIKDPNGFNYNGSGNTVSLKARGNHTSNPEPGDLIFYNNPEHVAVYIGNGKVIELGGTPGPNEEAINYRTVADQRNYSLEADHAQAPAPSSHNQPPSGQGPVGEPHLRGFEEQIPGLSG